MASARVTKNGWRLYAASVKAGADEITEMYAGLMEASAAVAAPYEYGVLQDSIAVEGASAGASLARRRIVVGAYYGLYQHEGTETIDGDPFLADAVEHWKDDYLHAIGLLLHGG